MKAFFFLALVLPFLATAETLFDKIETFDADSLLDFDLPVPSLPESLDIGNVAGLLDNVLQGLEDIVAWKINITIAPWETDNFEGLLFTTEQFNSIFPTMTTFKQPYNVSFNIYIPIEPFHLINTTGTKVSVKFNAHLRVLIPEVYGNNTYTHCNVTGHLDVQVIDVLRGMRLHIKDYMVSNVIVPDSESAKINQIEALHALNSLAQLGIDYGNYVLGHKRILLLDYLLYNPSELVYSAPEIFTGKYGKMMVESLVPNVSSL